MQQQQQQKQIRDASVYFIQFDRIFILFWSNVRALKTLSYGLLMMSVFRFHEYVSAYKTKNFRYLIEKVIQSKYKNGYEVFMQSMEIRLG